MNDNPKNNILMSDNIRQKKLAILEHFEFLMNQIFGQRFIIFEKLSIGINYC